MNSTVMTIGSSRNVLKNSMGIFVSRFLTTIMALISIPIVVDNLGILGYGTWESIIAVSLLCNIFQGTVSGTILWLVSNAYASKDNESVRQYIRSGVGVSLALFLIFTPLAWLARHFLVDVFMVPAEFAPTAAWIFPLIIGLMLLGCVNEILAGLIGGWQRARVAVAIQAVAVIVNNVLVIVFLMLGFEFWSLLLGFASGFLISAVGLYLMAVRIFGRLSLLPRLPTQSVLIKVAPYAGFLLLGSLSIAFRDQTDKVILASAASPAWTGYYGIAARLASLVTIVCTFFYIPTIAASGALFSIDDWPGIHRIYDDMITIMAFLVGLVVVLIAGLHDRLVFLWMGRKIPEVGGILYLLLIGSASAVILTGTGSSVCKGVGIVKIETIYIVIGLILNIALKSSLVPLIGAMGAVISSAASWSVSSVIFILLLHKYTKIPLAGSVKAAKTMLIIVACVLIARLLTAVYPFGTDRLDVFVSSVGLGTSLTMIFTFMMISFKVLSKNTIVQFKRMFHPA